MLLSLAASTAAVVLLAQRLSISSANGSLVILAAVSSKAFMDYTTSGLETLWVTCWPLGSTCPCLAVCPPFDYPYSDRC